MILGPHAGAEQLAAVRLRMGLDNPFPERYAIWLGQVLQGNLGTSYLNNQTVDSLVASALPVTLELSFLSLVWAMLIAVPAGIIAAIRKGSFVDRLVTGTGLPRDLDPGVHAGDHPVVHLRAQPALATGDRLRRA